jgi:hypothetical protein
MWTRRMGMGMGRKMAGSEWIRKEWNWRGVDIKEEEMR